jgi:AcrR family transcriptional regulator
MLFAERGFDGVTVRDICAAAGVKNTASIHYYFQSKDELVSRIIFDAVAHVDAVLTERLETIEGGGGPRSPREIAAIIVEATASSPRGADVPITTARILEAALQHRRRVVNEILKRERLYAIDRCLAHLARLLGGLPDHVVRQRLIYLTTYITGVMSARESALQGGTRTSVLWQSGDAIANLLSTCVGLLQAPAPAATVTADEGASPRVPSNIEAARKGA